MRVVMAASEAAPFAKSGGLGDVLGALPSTLRRLDTDAAVVIPAYSSIWAAGPVVRPTGWTLRVPVAQRSVGARVLQSVLDGGVPVYLIEQPEFFERDDTK